MATATILEYVLILLRGVLGAFKVGNVPLEQNLIDEFEAAISKIENVRGTVVTKSQVDSMRIAPAWPSASAPAATANPAVPAAAVVSNVFDIGSGAAIEVPQKSAVELVEERIAEIKAGPDVEANLAASHAAHNGMGYDELFKAAGCKCKICVAV